MRRLLLTSGLLLSAMLVLVFSTHGLAATRPQASAQHTVGQGDGPGRDVVLRDLPTFHRRRWLPLSSLPSPATRICPMLNTWRPRQRQPHTRG
jgi:hypothetical protein